MEPEVLETLSQLHKKAMKDYSPGSCLKLSLEVYKIISKYDPDANIMGFISVNQKKFSPIFDNNTHYSSHYAVLSNNTVYDPLFDKPKPLDTYLNNEFTEQLIPVKKMALKPKK